MKRFPIAAGIMALVLFIGLSLGAGSLVMAQGHGCGPGGKGFFGNLTDEQREAVMDKMQQMRDQNATPQETHSVIAELLKSFGVEVPDEWSEPKQFGHPWGDFLSDLTDQQKVSLRQEIDQMRDRGASPLEIRVATEEILESYGIKLKGPMSDLTKEQRTAVRQKIKFLLTKGAAEKEIQAEVAEMLKGYGVEIPEGRPGFMGLGPGRGGPMADLTDEQREAVHEKMEELRSQGASREEIHTQIAEMLKGYGVEVPDNPSERPGFGPPGGGPFADLTDEQRDAVHEKMEELRSQGATREEVHAAISELLEGFGIQSSDDSPDAASTTLSNKTQIVSHSYPNPFNPETQISYTLGVSDNVQIQIYNVSGQLIKTFDLGYQPAGSYSVKWDGRNENGQVTASGVYLYRIQAGTFDVTDRMVLLK